MAAPDVITPYSDLDELLAELLGHWQRILGGNLAGAYLQGSFALGSGDQQSDCDWLVATHDSLTEPQIAQLRNLHKEIPARDGHWCHDLEGSYAPVDELASVDHLERQWLFSRGHNREHISTSSNSKRPTPLVCTNHLLHRWPDPAQLPADPRSAATAAFTYDRWRALQTQSVATALVDDARDGVPRCHTFALGVSRVTVHVSYMESRQPGNPAGNTNEHVAAHVRAARQAIGMDLRTFAERVKETGRAMSPSALSKIENGDRRVDVDDLSVFAYILQTTPAALLSPPKGASPPTGVPSGQFNHEEIHAWLRGQAKFTTEDLSRYWKDEYFSAVNSIHYYDNLMMQCTKDGKGNQMHRRTYEERLASFRARRDAARVRLLALDPDALPAPRDETADGWA